MSVISKSSSLDSSMMMMTDRKVIWKVTPEVLISSWGTKWLYFCCILWRNLIFMRSGVIIIVRTSMMDSFTPSAWHQWSVRKNFGNRTCESYSRTGISQCMSEHQTYPSNRGDFTVYKSRMICIDCITSWNCPTCKNNWTKITFAIV